MKNIIVALDFSPCTELLLEQAYQYGKAFKAKVWLIHVAAPDPDFIGYEVGPEYIREDRANTLKKEHKTLGEYKEGLIASGVEAEALLIQGPTVETLLNHMTKLQADLLIIGKKGHSLLHKAFIGSIFSSVVKQAEIPVLAIPSIVEKA